MRWTITKDAKESGPRSRRGCGNYTLNPMGLPLRFRVRDGKGNVDYYGRADEECYAPLRFTEEDAEIQFAGEDGVYRTL